MRYKVLALFNGLLLSTLSMTCYASITYTPQTNYMLRCAGCHGITGAGTEVGGIPDFRNYVASFAQTQKGREYLMHVPGVVASSLSSEEISAVLNYIMQRWGGNSLRDDYQPFTEVEVAQLRQTNVKDVVAYRRVVVKELDKLNLPVAPYPWP